MLDAILLSSISELGAKRPERAEGERLWDRNSPLHICVCHPHKDVCPRRFIPYRGVNSTYGVVDYPMLDAILPSSISELGAKRPERAEGERLWDCNSPLHISVSSTQMYVLTVLSFQCSTSSHRILC